MIKIKFMLKNIPMVKKFLIYGLFGWSIEIIWTGVNSLIRGDVTLGAFTSLWMFLIYGLAVFLEPLHNIMKGWRWQFRGILWVIIIWGIEYLTGLILIKILGQCPWNYKGIFAIDGLIRLDFAPAWFIAGLIFEKIHYKIEEYFLLLSY